MLKRGYLLHVYDSATSPTVPFPLQKDPVYHPAVDFLRSRPQGSIPMIPIQLAGGQAAVEGA